MSLRLAFDLDGVLADLSSVLERRARAMIRARRLRASRSRRLPLARRTVATEAEEIGDGSRLWQTLDSRQRDQVWASLARKPRLWERLPELEPGTVARLGRLAVQRGWDVVFLTSRPAAAAGGNVQVQSQRWLASRGFELPTVIVCTGSRGPLATMLRRQVVVDDRSRGCLEVATESDARAVLVWRPDRGAPPPALTSFDVCIVASVSAALDHLVQTDRAHSDNLRLTGTR